jgi:hypothetical protein
MIGKREKIVKLNSGYSSGRIGFRQESKRLQSNMLKSLKRNQSRRHNALHRRNCVSNLV